MLSSKANAALTRLKEIEEKYKMKRKQQNWNREEDSSISSVSIDLPEKLSGKLKESPRNMSKPKIKIKMPDMRIDNEAATSNKINSRSLRDIDKVDLGVVVPLKDESQEDRKQENLSSDTTTIQENSSIDSVSVGSVNSSSRSVLRSKTSRQDAMASNKIHGREGRMRVERERTSDNKSSEISGEGKTSLDYNWSTTKRSRVSKKSNDLSSSRSDPKSKEHPFKVEANRPETANSSRKWHLSRTESPSDNSIIEESVDTVADDSEIISELSRIDESVAVKAGDSTNASQHSARPQAKDTSVTIVENSRQPVIEDGYANDTFEDASSSSTVRSELKFQNDEVTEEKNSDPKDEKVMDPVASKPSVTQVDLQSVSYVSDLETIGGADPDKTTMHLIKSSNSIDSRLEEAAEHYQHTESEKNASYKNASYSKLSISQRTETYTKVVSQRKSSSKTSVSEVDQQESSQESRGKTDETRERTTMDSPKEFEKANEHAVDERTSGERISQVAEDALRKLHRDVIETLSKRQAGLETARKASGDSRGRKAELRDDALTTRKITKVVGERRRSSAKNQEVERNSDRERSSTTKKRQARAKVTNSKLVKPRGSAGSRKEDKASNSDRKQMRVLRKRIVELRLRQEREDLQKYLRELKDLRLESSTARSYFSPLEFPRIAEFTLDATDSESKLGDHAAFRERLSAIRRWLKDQYILYRDYCTMAQAINAHYVPTTLEDAKKTIHGPGKTTLKTG